MSTKTIAFSGYRASKLPKECDESSTDIQQLKQDITNTVTQCITDGFDTFLVGMADGFDTLSARVVISLKSTYNIHLVCVYPYNSKRTEIQTEIENYSSKVIILNTEYNSSVYDARNKYLVDNATKLICYYDGRSGGTENTIGYAKKKGIDVINLATPIQNSNMPTMIDNKLTFLKDDLDRTIRKGDVLEVAGDCFSIYAYNELKKRLNNIKELKFIFTSPTFVTDRFSKSKREFYIPQLTREKSLYGTEFEVKLKNELSQKAIAKDCAKWVEKKVTFKSNITNENMFGFINVLSDDNKSTYYPINGFTTSQIGCERGNNAYTLINKFPSPMNDYHLNNFSQIWNDSTRTQDVTAEVLASISTAYKENSPEFVYFFTLYNIFSEFLEDINEDELPNDKNGFKDSKIWNKLYNFQKDAVLSIINKLEKYNGCILADSVGLGKTFSSLAVIKYYENRNKNVLVLCPKKLGDNWSTFKDNYLNNPIADDRLRYDVLYHSDLTRKQGKSNGLDLSRLNWSNYDLIVIDESHNFRNGGKLDEDNPKENRYTKLLKDVIKKGVKTKVLMLSATPVNNRFMDLKNQLQLAYEGDSKEINSKLNTSRSIDDIFKSAQRTFNSWQGLEVEERTTDRLLKMLDFDFFEVLDSVTIARSRKHIEKYYDIADIGSFPTRLKPISHSPKLTNLKDAINYNQIFENLMLLNLSIYTPSQYILNSKMDKYAELFGDNEVNVGFTQANREQGIKKLTAINLMKRMESSVYSFNLTVQRIYKLIEDTIISINNYESSNNGDILDLTDISSTSEFDYDDMNDNLFTVGKKVKIDIGDMDYITWRENLKKDSEILYLIVLLVSEITPQHDNKLQKLIEVMKEKIKNPINDENKKIIVFTAFSDTAKYLYENVASILKVSFGLNTALVTGSDLPKCTIPKLKSDLNTVLTLFSPISKDKQLLMPNDTNEIDILIATDCISEGQNLQDCDYLINYDIHWNPVRIIQRFGRIDRIGSKNECIQLVNFWADISLDEYINLKARVETRMKITVMTSTGDDNLISPEEKGDLEYRKNQLERLQEEVVDIEEMSSGINIMDLGLNEFRLDLLQYINDNGSFDKVPFGMHSITAKNDMLPQGTIYILKNICGNVNIENQNRLHPFYMVYIAENGDIICDHLSPKNMLDKMRMLCKGQNKENLTLCTKFNKETKDGKDMAKYSKLLSGAITSIIEVKEESDIDSFLSGSQVSFLSNKIQGLDDFELVCFLVVEDSQ